MLREVKLFGRRSFLYVTGQDSLEFIGLAIEPEAISLASPGARHPPCIGALTTGGRPWR